MKYLNELFEAGLLIPSGVDGIYGKNAVFEGIIEALDRTIIHLGVDQNAEVIRFPPAISTVALKKSEYLKGFPDLVGTVHCFCGNEQDHKNLLACVDANDDSWLAKQDTAGIALVPAACYPIYPVIANRGIVPSDGVTVDAFSYCYRHEPSIDPMRMQMFRMHEYIKIGTPSQVVKFRNEWIARSRAFVSMLDLPLAIDVANDPFFGRGGKIMANAQREQQLKFELLIPIDNPEKPAACFSFNYHLDHFGEIFNMRTDNNELAHTACVGFGMERITLALLKHHGFDTKKWPEPVRSLLWPSTVKKV